METEIRNHRTTDEMMMDLINKFPTGLYRWSGGTAWFQVDLTEFNMDVELTWFAINGARISIWLDKEGYGSNFEHNEEE